MSGFKVRLMGLSIKGELLSSGRILRTWLLWKVLCWVAISLQWVLFNPTDWEFYRKLRLGILRQLISKLEEMNAADERTAAHWPVPAQHQQELVSALGKLVAKEARDG